MATGKTPKGSDFGKRDADSTDPTASASSEDEILPGPGDSTNPTGGAPRAAYKLIALHGPRAGSEFVLDADEISLGRGTDNGISIPDVSVSRHHVRFQRDENGFSVVDLKSGNGTKVNGKLLERAHLKHGDEIVLGDTVLQYVKENEPAPERSRTPAPPSGKEAAPAAATETRSPVSAAPPPSKAAVPATAAVTDTAPSSDPVPPPPPAPKPPAPKKKGGNGIRIVLYGTLLLLLGLMVALSVRKVRHTGGGGGGDDSSVIIERAREMALARKWNDALTLLVEHGSKKADETVQHWTEGVRPEAGAETAFQKAQESLMRGDYKMALDIASTIDPKLDYGEDAREKIVRKMPEILSNALVDARTAFHQGDRERCKDIVNRILLASPTNGDALSVRGECSKVVVAAHEEKPVVPVVQEVDAGPQLPKYPCFGPAWTAYLTCDFPGGMRAQKEMAGCPDFAAKVGQIQEHLRKGDELAQGKRIPEADREFEQAIKKDAEIALDRPTCPAKQAKERFSKMEYLLALDAKGDEQLPNRCRHLRAAVAANPENDLAARELQKCYVRAIEIFNEAYQEKANDKESAVRGFRIAFQALPEGHDKKDKAKYWIDQLTKKGQ